MGPSMPPEHEHRPQNSVRAAARLPVNLRVRGLGSYPRPVCGFLGRDRWNGPIARGPASYFFRGMTDSFLSAFSIWCASNFQLPFWYMLYGIVNKEASEGLTKLISTLEDRFGTAWPR